MADPFIGEIRMLSFDYAPRGWAECKGQTIPIAQNQALFSLLGTAFGGNGVNTFQLPDLQGRAPMHAAPTVPMGQSGGEETHVLTLQEMPVHNHTVTATSATGTLTPPAGNFLSNSGGKNYGGATNLKQLNANAMANVGANQGHDNMSPFVVLTFAIALQGVFPSRQ